MNREGTPAPAAPTAAAAPSRRSHLTWGLLLLVAALAVAVWFAPAAGLPRSARAGLICLLFAVALWSLDIVPKGLSGLAVVAALAVSGAAPGFQRAALGFASDPFFFLIAIWLTGIAAARAGLVDRAAWLLLLLGRGGRNATLWALSATLGSLALFMPTAAGRFQAVKPVLDRVGDTLGEPRDGGFRKAGLLIAGVFGPLSSIGVMTGGGLTIVSSGLLNQLGASVSWLQWLVAMLPAGLLLLAVATWATIRRQPRAAPRYAPVTAPAAGPLSGQERWVVGSLGLATLLWISGTWLHLNPALPAILVALLLSLPRVGLVRAADLGRLDWNGLLMIGAALSLGDALAHDGLGDWLAAHVLRGGTLAGSPLHLLLLLLLTLVLRVVIVSPPACMSLVLPLLVRFSASPQAAVPLALAVIFAVGTFQPLPTHSPASIVGFSAGGYSVRDQIVLSAVVLPVSLAVTLAAYYLYWPHLHLMG